LNGGVAKAVERLAALTVKLWLEEKLWALHADRGWDGDNTLIREGELHVLLRGVFSFSEFSFVVLGNEGTLFFDVLNNFKFGCGSKRFTSSKEELLHPISEETTSDFHLFNGVGDAVAFINWNSVGYTITSVANKTSCSTSSVKGHDSLKGNIGVLDLECFEHD